MDSITAERKSMTPQNNNMASTNLQGSSKMYGKRKRGTMERGLASSLSRHLFYNKGPKGAPILNARAVDKIVSRSLKTRMINPPEQKYFDSVATGSALSATQVVTLLSGILQGTGPINRTGNKIRVSKVEFTAIVTMSPTASLGSDDGKVSLFIQKQCNGVAVPQFTVASGASALVPYNNNGGAPYPLLVNASYENEFYITKDWDYTLDASAGVAAAWQGDTQILKAEIKINRTIEYNTGNAGTVADCIRNAFWIGYVGSQTVGATQSTITYYHRIWFTDA